MNNIIAKTALKTVIGIVIAAIIAFGVASLGFPSSMASMWASLGNYSFATGYSSLAYSYSGTVDDLATCFDYSVLAGSDDDIIKYGQQLISHEDFSSYCEERDANSSDYAGSYNQFACGYVAAAEYRKGDSETAFVAAYSAMNGVSDFPEGNALIVLSLEVISAEDGATAAKILEVLSEFFPEGEYQTAAYNTVKTNLEKI